MEFSIALLFVVAVTLAVVGMLFAFKLTPHHADCWKYYGACSTYGCREREFAFHTGKIEA